jgi:hypothetical protein
MRRISPSIAMLAVGLVATTVQAERAPEERSKATHVLTGTVEAVFVSESKTVRSYIVAINIESMDKGDGYKEGERFYASCYQRKKSDKVLDKNELLAYDPGHDLVPEIGQRIKVFVHRRGGKFEGVFPDWVDVLSQAKKKKADAISIVQGTVRIDGKPLAKGTIAFHPDKGVAIETDIKNGEYTLKKVPVGTMKITVKARGLPLRYESKDRSNLLFEVKEGKQTLELELLGR